MRNVTRQPCETRTLHSSARGPCRRCSRYVGQDRARSGSGPVRTGSLAAAAHAPDPLLWHRCGCAAARLRAPRSSVSASSALQQDMLWIPEFEAVIAVISCICPRQASLDQRCFRAKSMNRLGSADRTGGRKSRCPRCACVAEYFSVLAHDQAHGPSGRRGCSVTVAQPGPFGF